MADSSASCVSVPKNYRKIIKFSSDRCRDHQLKKRQPHKYETGNKIVYVSTKTTLKALYEKCEKLIHDNENEIVIHCLGAAIQRGILLSLQICNKYPTFKTDVNTLTTELTDDLEPATDEVDYEIQKRNNSALRIRVFRTDVLKTEIKEACSSQLKS